jgi:hypothetical protein
MQIGKMKSNLIPPKPAPFPKMAPYDDVKFEIHLVGDKCTIKKDSDLYFLMLDSLSRMMINILDGNANIDVDKFSSLSHTSNSHFIRAVEKNLAATLSTNIRVTRVETFRDFAAFSNNVMIGISVLLDQGYIDNYVDHESEQMINFAFKNVGQEYADSK